MTPIGSESLFASTAPGRISHQKEVGQRRYASFRIFTGLATWSSGSSTRSSTVGVWQRASTNSQPTTSHSSSLHPYACGYALVKSTSKSGGGLDHPWGRLSRAQAILAACPENG